MPEGDTIFRAAQTLGKAIGGKVVLRARSPLPALKDAALEGRRIERVEAHGKNLLIHFDDGRSLLTHMRMTGSWHIYRPGERWQKPERAARVVLETHDFVAVCFNAPVVELLREGGARVHPVLPNLGPDVLKDDFDITEAGRRLRERGATPIGEAILNQRLLAGVGNVYKSEVLFLCRVDPFAPVASLSDEELSRILDEVRELMKQNLDGRPRTTRRALQGPRLWVYGRSGRQCLVCGAMIRMRRQGLAGRSTYWCPTCQPPRAARSPHAAGA